MTKVFTAAAIFRLQELQQISIEDTLDKILPQAYVDALTSHGISAKNITISQLLTHTSGLPDYATQPEFESLAFTDPQHHWTRMEQIEFALQYYTPSDDIKHPFVYADTNYILLGEIIEQRTGLSLGASFINC